MALLHRPSKISLTAFRLLFFFLSFLTFFTFFDFFLSFLASSGISDPCSSSPRPPNISSIDDAVVVGRCSNFSFLHFFFFGLSSLPLSPPPPIPDFGRDFSFIICNICSLASSVFVADTIPFLFFCCLVVLSPPADNKSSFCPISTLSPRSLAPSPGASFCAFISEPSPSSLSSLSSSNPSVFAIVFLSSILEALLVLISLIPRRRVPCRRLSCCSFSCSCGSISTKLSISLLVQSPQSVSLPRSLF
mmetsp:Transcript_9559/g.22523  ORF Transcript_9559/g.22523 Transcript_9559/m.22523 type:complete len:247 (-) Transcript_9559:142-882(-)